MSREPGILQRSALLRGETDARARPSATRVREALETPGWCPPLPQAVTRLFLLVEGQPRRSELVDTLAADPDLARRTVAHIAVRAEHPSRAPLSLAAAVRMTRLGDLCTAALDGALSRGMIRGALLTHARQVGDLAAAMASDVGAIPHRARAAGLLHDIGRVGLELAAARSRDLVLTRALTAMHHAEAAAAMVRIWRLPGVLGGAIGPDPTALGLLVQLAEALVLDAGTGHTHTRSARGVAWDLPAHVPALATELGLSAAGLRSWRRYARGD